MLQLRQEQNLIESWLITAMCIIGYRDYVEHNAILNPSNPDLLRILFIVIATAWVMLCVRFIREGNGPERRRWFIGRFVILVLVNGMVSLITVLPIMLLFSEPSKWPIWGSLVITSVLMPFTALLIFCKNRKEKIKLLFLKFKGSQA